MVSRSFAMSFFNMTGGKPVSVAERRGFATFDRERKLGAMIDNPVNGNTCSYIKS
jgi:hypothetical protein